MAYIKPLRSVAVAPLAALVPNTFSFTCHYFSSLYNFSEALYFSLLCYCGNHYVNKPLFLLISHQFHVIQVLLYAAPLNPVSISLCVFLTAPFVYSSKFQSRLPFKSSKKIFSILQVRHSILSIKTIIIFDDPLSAPHSPVFLCLH